MNNRETEKNICMNFFEERFSERLLYELGSEKKRCRFFDRLHHTAADYLKSALIKKRFKMPPSEEEIIKFIGCGQAYFMDGRGGGLRDISRGLEEFYLNRVYIIASPDCVKIYLETEYDFSVHEAFFLSL